MIESPFEKSKEFTEKLTFEEAKEVIKNFDVQWYPYPSIISSTGIDTVAVYIEDISSDLDDERVSTDVILKATGEERVYLLLLGGWKDTSYGKLKNLKFVLQRKSKRKRWWEK